MTSDGDVTRLREIVEAQLGLRLERTVAAAVLAKRGARLLARLEADPAEVRSLAAELTIGETYFYRHAEQIEAYRVTALPDRLAQSEVVRVLSAGCSSGEEPYTLAMVAHESRENADRVAVDAIDVNVVALEKAKKARYTRWSLRSVPPELERRWFTQEGSLFAVVPEIRNAVRFTRATLTDPLALQGRYDIVFCRNVLMYFHEAALQQTIARIVDALVPGGYLFLGHAEILREAPAGVVLCEGHGTFFYRKGERIAKSVQVATPTEDWVGSIAAASERVRSLSERATNEAEAPVVRDIDAAIADARTRISSEDYVGALAVLEALPAHLGEVALLRAIALTEHGNPTHAIAACEALLGFPLLAAHAHYLLAVASESTGELAAAAGHAKRATEHPPALAMAHLRLGLIARRIGDSSSARRALAHAVEALATEPVERLALHAGGLGRDGLIRLCKAELAAIEGDRA